MGYIVRMPKLGMEMQEGTLLEWVVEEDESVEADEPIAEIESEKSVTDVTAREAGVLSVRLLDVDQTVEPGTPMAIVADPEEDIDELIAEAREELRSGVGEREEGNAETDTTQTDTDAGGEREVPRPRASPKARKLSAETGVDLATVDGSGPGGAVVAADVQAVAGEATDGTTPTETGSGERADSTGRTVTEQREFDGMRRTIADRLGESYRNAVHVTVDRDVDLEQALHAKSVAEDALDIDVSVTDLLLVGVSEALAAHPEFNATYEDGVHTLYEEQHVGVAVDVDAGLVTPVLRDLQDRSLADVAEQRRSLTELALDREYTSDTLAGGTFTVSNLGVLGADAFTPIIDPPQVAILGINRIREAPRSAENGDGVEFRRTTRLSLSFDHRVVDGADAARFLETLADTVENPWTALFERT